MTRFHGRVIDVKASTTMLDPKCPQLLRLHSVSGCDTNGYFFRKGNLIALRLLRNNDYPLLRSLPPTSPNFALHMKRAHLHVMMWKAAAKRALPTAAAAANISKVGWEVRDGSVFIPAIHTGSPVQVMRELSCGCRSEETCVGGACGCPAKHIPCTTHCKCTGLCCNPHSVDKSVDIEEDDEEAGEID